MSFGKIKSVFNALEDIVLGYIDDYIKPYQSKSLGATLEIYRDEVTREWRWKLRSARLHVCIAQSGEGYHSREDLEKALEKVKGSINAAKIRDLGN